MGCDFAKRARFLQWDVTLVYTNYEQKFGCLQKIGTFAEKTKIVVKYDDYE